MNSSVPLSADHSTICLCRNLRRMKPKALRYTKPLITRPPTGSISIPIAKTHLAIFKGRNMCCRTSGAFQGAAMMRAQAPRYPGIFQSLAFCGMNMSSKTTILISATNGPEVRVKYRRRHTQLRSRLGSWIRVSEAEDLKLALSTGSVSYHHQKTKPALPTNEYAVGC